MPVLYIPVGIPGCGKSTLAHALCPDVIISSDAIRAEPAFGGNVYDQSKNDLVFSEFHRRIESNLIHGRDVFADATSLNKFARDKLKAVADKVDRVAPYRARTHVLLFRNLEQAIARNALRERVVPHDAMLRMIEKYEQTIQSIYDEGWEHITEISKVS